MVKAQEWLNKKYKTSEEKEKVMDLHINERGLEGELDLTDFTGLKKIYFSHFYIGKDDEIKLIKMKGTKDEVEIIKLKDAQNLLSREIKKGAKEINLTELLFDKDENELKYNKEGELKIEDFKNLKEIKIDKVGEDYIEFAKINKMTIANCPKLEKVDINTFIDNEKLEITNCPELTDLDCSYNQLKELDLNNLANSEGGQTSKLEKLDCNSNQLTKLDVKGCSNLTKLYCHNNLLTDVTLPEKAESLKVLSLLNNDFKETTGWLNKGKDLSFLKGYTNLERLYLGNFTDHEDGYFKHYDETKNKTKIYNRFSGSLKDLENLDKLKVLDISNTDVSIGNDNLENLLKSSLNSLEEIYCSSKERPGSKVKIVKKELEKKDLNFYFSNNRYIKKRSSQEWLDKNYPESDVCKNKHDQENKDKKRKDIIKLDIKEWGLWGNLDLSGFTNLQELDCSNNQLESLNLEKNTYLTKINLSGNKLKEINLKSNTGLKEICCQDNQLTELDLSSLYYLTNLDANNNKLKSINLNGVYYLTSLNVNDNKLESIDLSGLYYLTSLNVNNNEINDINFLDTLYYKYKKNLTVLNIGNNPYKNTSIEKQKQSRKRRAVKHETLDFLKPFINLTELDISEKKGNDECFFSGSLKPLEDMSKLEIINISGTDINSGYLPVSCRKLICISDSKKKSDKIAETFRKYRVVDHQDNDYYDLKKWRDDIGILLNQSDTVQKDIKKFFSEWRGEALRSELKSPEELKKYREGFEKVKWLNRTASMSGGALSLTGYPEIGGWIGVIGPLAEAYISYKEEEMCGIYERKWDEFMKSMKRFWNHYRELVDVLGPLEFCGKESEELKPLWKIIKRVSSEVNSKDEFALDLKKNWDAPSESRRKQWSKIAEYMIEINEKGKSESILKDEVLQEQEQYESRIEIPTNFPNYGSTGTSK